MRAVASRSSAMMCVSAAGMMIHGVQSCSARTARLFARKLSACVRGARPESTEMHSAAYAARPLARAISQKTRSIYDFFVTVTAGRVVVCTLVVSVVVVVVAVEGTVVAAAAVVAFVVATAATVAGWSGAIVTYGCVPA